MPTHTPEKTKNKYKWEISAIPYQYCGIVAREIANIDRVHYNLAPRTNELIYLLQ
jgi:hypothetical protein